MSSVLQQNIKSIVKTIMIHEPYVTVQE